MEQVVKKYNFISNIYKTLIIFFIIILIVSIVGIIFPIFFPIEFFAIIGFSSNTIITGLVIDKSNWDKAKKTIEEINNE